MKSEKGFIEVILIILIVIFVILLISIIGIEIYKSVSYGEKEGIIINKYYKDSYITTSYIMSGKVMIPITNYYPESWNFELQKEVAGKIKTITVKVSQNIYEKYNIGDFFKENEK